MGRYNLVLFLCGLRTGHFGQGTFVHNLLPYFKSRPDIDITLIKTDCSDIVKVVGYKEDGVEVVALPRLQRGPMLTGENSPVQKSYANRFIGMVYHHLKDKPNLFFWGNSIDYLNVFYELKKVFPNSRSMYVHHSFSWKYLISVDDHVFNREWNAGNESFHSKAFEMTKYQQEMALISDIVVTVTQHAREFFITPLKINPEKIITIYNGCPIPTEKRNKQQLRRKYGFHNYHKIILFSGRITRDKGFTYLLKAFKILADNNKHARLVIMGAGRPFEDIALAYPHWSKIVFTGELAKSQINEFYQIADVGVIPSLHEQCSFTAIEMRLFKLPILTSAYDGLGEVFTDNYDALMLSPKTNALYERIIDESEMAEKLLELLENKKLRKQLSDNSYKKAVELFSSKRMWEQYGKIFASVF